ncbi:MAG TPA: response regulator [Ideonella sp.]|uniref:ATP-binding response regulator n=1 Tax=Ideonella sp. TaxID=1929293 RepID=UPI002BB105DB|nr:response regulator [Ideonella sp.]HSI47240.1 response regulator [Ideonella sp.]
MAAKPLNILVVDDVPQNLLAMRALLAADDWHVLTADSADAALELLLQHDVALALLDVQMPGLDGYALAELMRGAERTRHVPIIFLTAGSMQEQRSFRGYEAGAVDFLYKPFDGRVLRSKVAIFADLHRQKATLAENMAELQRLTRLNSTMLSALSHDIRAPLAALALNAELLLRSDKPGPGSAGARIKAAITMLSRQVDHLVNLAQLPSAELRPSPVMTDLAALTQARLEMAQGNGLLSQMPAFEAVGDTQGLMDRAMLQQALDHLLLQATSYAGEAGLKIELDGDQRRLLLLRISFAGVLSDAASQHLFGGGEAVEGMAAPRVGAGLSLPEQVARAHGGSLIGRSRLRDGTQFELMLPRGI